MPTQYAGVIGSAAQKYGLGDMLARVADAESDFNPNAGSSAGAQGMFQFMPATAKGYGIDPYNVEQAADAAGKMLSGLLAKYDGDWEKALSGYNAGGGKTDSLIKKYGNRWKQYAPQETQKYIKKILG